LRYASRNGFLVAEGSEEELVKRIMSRWEVGLLVYGSAILLSFVSTAISLRIYAFVLILLVLQSALGFKALWERLGEEGLVLLASLYIYMDSR
jgi:hypothetical protein